MARDESNRRPRPEFSTPGPAGNRAVAPPREPPPLLASELLERVSDAFVALDRQWRYTYVNREAARIMGTTSDALLGRHVWTLWPEAVDGPFYEAFQRAMREQVFVEIEACHQPWEAWFHFRIHPSPDGLSVFFHDVTERHRAEEEASAGAALLKAQSDVLELVARRAPLDVTLDRLLRAIEAQAPGVLASILLLDEEGTRVRHGAAPSLPEEYMRAIDGEPIGPAAGSCGTAAHFGRPVIVEDIATDPLWEPYRAVALSFGLRACWSTPIFDGEGRVLGTFALYQHKAGAPLESHRRVIDMVTYTAAIAIVQHRESAEAKRREVQFEQAERLAHFGSYIWEASTGRVHRSEELCRIFGIEPGAFPPTVQAYFDRIHPDDRDQTRTMIEESMRTREPFTFEERIVRPDGSLRHLHSLGRWILDDEGTAVALVGVCHDVTERRRAEAEARRTEQLRARNEELKAFTYMVSHDLKAPLRGIAGYARELSTQHQGPLSERGRECVQRIMAGAANLDRLIEDLLDYARLEAETPTAGTVDLQSCIRGVLAAQDQAVRTHGTQVTVDLGVGSVTTWSRGLTQILGNLVDNAIKFSREAKPPQVRISSEAREGGIRITVADNGIGFDPRHQERIFGLFNRLVPRDAFEGTGAGLAVVSRIAQKIGASVTANARPGGGATFVLDLPASSRGR